MSEQAGISCQTLCWSTDSCVICRDDGKTQRLVRLTPGYEYTECQPLTWADGDDPCAVIPMTAMDEPIAGINTCYQNLTDTPATDVCPTQLLCGAIFDVAMMNWPEGTTVKDLETLICRSEKPCFASRTGCVELPEQYKTAAGVA